MKVNQDGWLTLLSVLATLFMCAVGFFTGAFVSKGLFWIFGQDGPLMSNEIADTFFPWFLMFIFGLSTLLHFRSKWDQ